MSYLKFQKFETKTPPIILDIYNNKYNSIFCIEILTEKKFIGKKKKKKKTQT